MTHLEISEASSSLVYRVRVQWSYKGRITEILERTYDDKRKIRYLSHASCCFLFFLSGAFKDFKEIQRGPHLSGHSLNMPNLIFFYTAEMRQAKR